MTSPEKKAVTPSEIYELLRHNGRVISGITEAAAFEYFIKNNDVSFGLTKPAIQMLDAVGWMYYPLAYLINPARRLSLRSDSEMFASASKPLPFHDLDIHTHISDDGALDLSHYGWLLRQYLRTSLDITSVPDWLHKLNNIKTWWHYPTASLTDPGMVEYTPSQAYGVQDRRVQMKVGKYLAKFYADQLTSDQIRDIANLAMSYGVRTSSDVKDMLRVYKEGPSSCMSGDKFSDETHPVLAYGFPGEFEMAWIEKNGNITARGLIHRKLNAWVRVYGNDMNHLSAAFRKMGLEKKPDWRGAKLAHVLRKKGYVSLPYLDGDDSTAGYVKFVPKDGDTDAHFLVLGTSKGAALNARSADCVHAFDARVLPCQVCGKDHPVADLEPMWNAQGDYVEDAVCGTCQLTDAIVYAHGSGGRTAWARVSDTVQTADNDRYLNTEQVRAEYNIGTCPLIGDAQLVSLKNGYRLYDGRYVSQAAENQLFHRAGATEGWDQGLAALTDLKPVDFVGLRYLPDHQKFAIEFIHAAECPLPSSAHQLGPKPNPMPGTRGVMRVDEFARSELASAQQIHIVRDAFSRPLNTDVFFTRLAAIAAETQQPEMENA